jgi:hypothetical protein
MPAARDHESVFTLEATPIKFGRLGRILNASMTNS